jgi:hypothetical protein
MEKARRRPVACAWLWAWENHTSRMASKTTSVNCVAMRPFISA